MHESGLLGAFNIKLEILEAAARAVTEQAAKADALVAEGARRRPLGAHREPAPHGAPLV